MKSLVTGGTGFLGKRLALRLVELGHEVSVIGRNERVGLDLEESGINFIKADLKDTNEITEACKNQDYVFHCGALSSPWGKYQDFYNTNVLGTKNIIQGCQKHKIKRLIYVSTPSIYFDFTDKFNISENTPLPENPVNDYAKTKLMAEKKIDKAFNEGLPVITIRPRGIFGPGDTSILPRLIKANNNRFIPVIEHRKVLVDITYVDNIIEALLLCIDSPEYTLGKKYNITNGEPVLLYDFLENVITKLGYKFNPKTLSFNEAYKIAGLMEFISRTLLFGKEPALTQYTVGILARSQTLDISSAKRELGYVPKISINDGVDELIRWWKDKHAC